MYSKAPFFPSHLPTRSKFVDTISSSYDLPSSTFIPKLKNTTPNLDLSHIPPLSLTDSSNKRLDLSDLDLRNPVQKKVKYNPEVVLYSGLFSQVLPEPVINYNIKPLFEEYLKQLTSQTKQLIRQKKMIENENQSFEFNAPTFKKREIQKQEKPRLLNCFEIPQNKKPVTIKKVINDSLQTSEQLQQALESLKQKIVTKPQSDTNVQQSKLAKPQKPELTVRTSRAIFDIDISNCDQLNLAKNIEVCSSGSPLSTTEDSANSCSTSDLCESEKLSPLWPYFSDLEPTNIMQPQFANQLNLFNFSVTEQDVLADSHPEIRNVTSKPSDSEISETLVSFRHQAEIPILCSDPGLFRPRRCLKPKWNPSSIQENELNEYFSRLQESLKCTINQEKAIKILRECDNEPCKVYKRIEGKEKEFAREFLIRPKRKP